MFDMDDLSSTAEAGFLKGIAWAVRQEDGLTVEGILAAARAYAAQFPVDFASALEKVARQ